MGTILVTGAAGRLGSLVCSALLSEGYFVRGIVKPGSKASLPAGAEREEADLVLPIPASAFSDVEAVVHCAGLVGEKPYGQLLVHNAFAVKNLLASCPESVEKIILASSISVYGQHPGVVADESFPTNPDTNYGKSKLLAEMFARDYRDAKSICLLRFGMIYGSSFTDGYFQVLSMLQSGKMRIVGDGRNRLPLLHQADAVSSVFEALNSCRPGCHEYNIVGCEQKTQRELLSIAAGFLGVPAPSKSVPAFAAILAVKAQRALSFLRLAKPPSLTEENIRQLSSDRAYSTDKARKELGFEAKVKLEDGINEVVQSYLSWRRGSK
ncbi:MAG: NAD(P)-dependent oxidoreductase [Candidatus Micrarchaeota archaeon]|nr:NAD(P)-dependent oxidoreductase [Candidatus Micrarchaeota archaeon]